MLPGGGVIANVQEDIVTVGDHLGHIGHALPNMDNRGLVQICFEVIIDLPLGVRH